MQLKYALFCSPMPTHTHTHTCLNRVKLHLDRVCVCMCNLPGQRSTGQHTSPSCITQIRQINNLLNEDLTRPGYLAARWESKKSWCCAYSLALEGHKLGATIHSSSTRFKKILYSGWLVRATSVSHFSFELYKLECQKYSMFYQAVPYSFKYHLGLLTTLAYPLLQNFCVSLGHLSVENLSWAQKHGFHSRTLKQSDLILPIQREKPCKRKQTITLHQVRKNKNIWFLK